MTTRVVRFNRYNTTVMLLALCDSDNDSVAERAKSLLRAPDLEKACLEAVDRGLVGGFLEAVIGGDFFDAFTRADGHNRKILAAMVSDAVISNFDDEIPEVI